MESDVKPAKRCCVMEDEFETYDVFISHRGPDTKTGFVGFLYNYLEDAGLRPFLDCKSIHKGQDAWTCIEHAIKTTPIALVIFSENFAQSQWCMKELHVMLDTCGIKVLPIFYKVQPCEVSLLKNGKFVAAFDKLKQRHDESVIKQWKEDLSRVSKLNGWEHRATDDHSLEVDLVKHIVKEVLELANKPLPLDVGDHVFGVKEVAQGIIQKLDENEKVMMLGLWGMGGIGKSTLAKELYNRLSKRFAVACYVEDVKDKVKQPGGQEEVLNCILNGLCPNDTKKIINKSEAKSIFKERLCKKRILLVLDDVHDKDDIGFWISREMLAKGSLCIVTSRDKRVFIGLNAFKNHEVHIHEVLKLDRADSIRVLASFAFGDHDKVKVGFEDMVKSMSKACGGIPLVLKVCGALLQHEEDEEVDVDVWSNVLGKLNSGTIMDEVKIYECLHISYDALQQDYLKEMFLDITCALLGKPRDLAARAWDSHGWPGALGIRTLVERALVTVDKNGCLRMHDHLRDMGHEIVRKRRESDEVIRRLWMPESSTFLDANVELLESLETLIVFNRSPFVNSVLDISHMKKLRILMCDDSTKVTSIPKSLYWWDWYGSWFGGLEMERIFPTVLPKNKLMFLNLQGSGITMVPETFQELKNLDVLNLKGCAKLLILPESFGGLKKLRDLNLELCGITSLPETFGGLIKLEVLNLSKCADFSLLPESIGDLKMLRDLSLEGSQITRLPESFGGLSNLEMLNLTACRKLLFLPHSIRCLLKVKNFSYSGSAFERLLQVVGKLDDFEMLNIPSKLMKLSSLLEILSTLKHLQFGDFRFAIEALPESFGDLSNLEVLSLEGCSNLTLLPSSFGGLRKLRDLTLGGSGVSSLPESFGDLCNLEVLSLKGCSNLALLPRSFGGLRKLRDLTLGGSGVSSLPESFEDLCNLEVLSLKGCSNLALLPKSFGGLRKLRDLTLDGSGVSSLPESFGDLSNLEVLCLSSCGNLKLLPSSLQGLSKLRHLQLDYSGVSKLLDSFGDLCNLEVLRLERCSNLTLLPSSFEGLGKLRDLTLGGSRASSLPESFRDLNNLEVLCLSLCQNLKLLPSSFHGLRNLRHLNLYYCGVRKLPESFGDLSSLEVLSLGGCSNLTLLPSSFGGLRKLRDLTLADSGVSSLPESFGDLKNLEVLRLSRCGNLKLLPSSFQGLESSAISSMPESFGGLSSLRELDLSWCRSIEALPQSFTQLSSLLKLNLTGCPACKSFVLSKHLMRADLNVRTGLSQESYLSHDQVSIFEAEVVPKLAPGLEEGWRWLGSQNSGKMLSLWHF